MEKNRERTRALFIARVRLVIFPFPTIREPGTGYSARSPHPKESLLAGYVSLLEALIGETDASRV